MVIDEFYSIENDAHQWILKYECEGDINTKTGKPSVSKSKWYCVTLRQALNRYLDESLKLATDVRAVKGHLNIAMERIIELTNKIDKDGI